MALELNTQGQDDSSKQAELIADTILASMEEVDLNPETAFKREIFFEDVSVHPDFAKHDADDISNQLGESGNEQTFSAVLDEADTTGDELGNMHVVEKDVDMAFSARSGSLDKTLSEPMQSQYAYLQDLSPEEREQVCVCALYDAGVDELQIQNALQSKDAEGSNLTALVNLLDQNTVEQNGTLHGIKESVAAPVAQVAQPNAVASNEPDPSFKQGAPATDKPRGMGMAA